MYSSVKNIQILVSLLMQHNIKDIVISPGSRNFQLVHTVETTPFFNCYTVVDERSAAYFAIGLSEAYNRPVCVCCTSSTATCNYFPAIKEAHDRHIPLLVLTADRDYRRLYQMEDQMIKQDHMYGNYTIKNVDIPIIRDRDDIWYAERKINEAIISLNSKPYKSPVQINYQIMELGAKFIDGIPVYRKISKINLENLRENINNIREELKNKHRILLLIGQDYGNDKLKKLIKKTFENFNIVISADSFSNIKSDYIFKTALVTESMGNVTFKDYEPDLVITMGGHIWSFIKLRLQESKASFEHWRISEDGEIVDPFKKLKYVFECSPEDFLNQINKDYSGINDGQYYSLWKKRLDITPNIGNEFTNFYAINKLCNLIPKESIVHTSILNATRLYDFVNTDFAHLSFSNLGTDGIDGCLPTFLGEASMFPEKPAFLITGDLSFFYGMNAILQPISPNVHIMLINNFSGSEFHTNFNRFYNNDNVSVDDHIAAGHRSVAKPWIIKSDIKYFEARNKDEFCKILPEFIKNYDTPVMLELYTNADSDTNALLRFYKSVKKITLMDIYRKILELIKFK